MPQQYRVRKLSILILLIIGLVLKVTRRYVSTLVLTNSYVNSENYPRELIGRKQEEEKIARTGKVNLVCKLVRKYKITAPD